MKRRHWAARPHGSSVRGQLPSLSKRLLWMLGIWLASVLSLSAVPLVLRWVLG